mgnify:CR=1 FL=1
MQRLLVTLICSLICSIVSICGASAQGYPTRPITFIVPWGPGGGADQLARVSSKIMEPDLKISVPVINVPGATGQTGLTKLTTSQPDGYTIEVMTGDTFLLFGLPNSRFKPADVMPLAVMIQQPSGLFANADGPLKTWDDVVRVAKERELKVAVTGFNSPDDVTVKYLKHLGINLQSIPFPEPGLRYSSVIGGQSDLVYEQAGDVRAFLDGKQMRPVIFFSEKKVSGFDDVAVSGERGYKIVLPQFRVVIAHKDTKPEMVSTLAGALDRVSKTQAFSDYLKQQYARPDSYVPQERSAKFMTDWMEEAQRLIATTSK